MRRRGFIAGLVAFTVAGCAGPRRPIPDAARIEPPGAWRTDPGMAGVDVTPEWWRAFGDPALVQLVTTALANNTDIAIAASRVEEADARVRLALGGQLPSVDFEGTGIARRRTYSTVTGQGIEFSAYQAQLAVSFDADLFGRLRNQTRAARAALLATRAASDGVRIAVVASVVSSYVSLRAVDASAAVLDATLASRRRQLALVRHQVAEGYANAIAESQASAAMHEIEQKLADARLQRRTVEDALSIVLGTAPGAIVRGRALTDLPLLPAPATLPARLLRRRPDIAEAEQKIVAADRSLDAARAAFMPDLSLSGSLGRLGADLLPDPLTIWSFAGSVLAPIFQGGKLRAQADIATAQRDQAAFAYRATVLDAFREVEDALAGLRELATKEAAALAAQADYARTLRAAKHRFGEGQTDYLEVLDAERGLLAAQQSLVATRADRLSATVQLYQAMGGGWAYPADWARPQR